MSHAKVQLPRFDDIAAFQAWQATQPGRWELHDGIPVAMAPERVNHARIKFNVASAFERSRDQRQLPCEAFIDGPAVRAPGLRQFQPDAIVACGEAIAGGDILIPDPIILVEVLSPSTMHIDVSVKLDGYFALPSVHHYLVISTEARIVVHHRRLEGSQILTHIHREGSITLDPPGLSIDMADIYARTDILA
jgi:Uma2 family endonuclease